MQADAFRPGNNDMNEQCANLSMCIDRLTEIIEHQPGRKDLYVLRTLMENALTCLHTHHLRRD